MLIVFFVCLLLLMLLFFPFKMRLMAHFNLIEMKGFYSFKAWRIKILCGKVYRDAENKFVIENTDNMVKNRYKDKVTQKFSLLMLKLIDVKKVELFFTGGFKENSFSSALVCSAASLFVDVTYAYLSNKYISVKLIEDVKPTFDEDNFELTFDFVAAVSIFNVIKSAIKAKLEVRKERLNERIL